MDKQCEFCGKLFLAKRSTARYCSDLCKVSASRGKAPKEVEVELKELPTKIGLPPLEEVDRTRAFTPEEMELVRKLSHDLWIAYMERPNSATTMTYEERIKHYVSANYPHGSARYEKAGEQSSRWGAH